jgi:hypothetical protein
MPARRPGGRPKKLRALRRALVLPFLAAALLLLPLALWRRWDSRIVADVEVSELSFDLLDTRPLLDPRRYERVQISRRASGELRTAGAARRVAIAPEGSLTIEQPLLNELQIAPPARVTLARHDPSTLDVSIAGAPAIASWSMANGSMLECEWCEIDGTAHRRYRTRLEGEAVLRLESPSLRLVLGTADTAVFVDNLTIARPAFVSGTAERPSSSVIGEGGSVTLRDLPDVRIDVLKGEDLAFRDPHDFKITTIEGGKRGLRVVMTGSAREVRSRGRNRLPSLLGRVHTSQSVALYVTAVIFVAGTVVNVFRQLQFIEEPK